MTDPIASPADSWVVETWTSNVQASCPISNASANAQSTGVAAKDLTANLMQVMQMAADMLACSDLDSAAGVLADRLQLLLGCRQVAVGTSERHGRRIRLRGLSGGVHWDRHSSFVMAIEEVWDETCQRGTVVEFPTKDNADDGTSDERMSAVFESLAKKLNTESLVSLPLVDRSGHSVGRYCW